MTRKRRALLQQYELTKAKSWRDPVMVKRFLEKANELRPLTEMQWYWLRAHHGAELINQIEKQMRGELEAQP